MEFFSSGDYAVHVTARVMPEQWENSAGDEARIPTKADPASSLATYANKDTSGVV